MIDMLCIIDSDEEIQGSFDEVCVYDWKVYTDYFNGYYLNSDTYNFLFELPSFPSSSALDIFYLSIFVYYADKKIKRESFFDGWTRL